MCSTKLVVFLVALVSNLMFIGAVQAQSNENFYAIPTVSPSPSSYNNVENNTSVVVGVQSVNPNGNPLFFNTYNQTTVTLVYAECMNSSLQVSTNDINWYENRGPTQITFATQGIATYALHFQVLYGATVNQSITLSIHSGDGKTTSLPLSSYNSGFTLDVTISTDVLPSYPSAQDIWNYGAGQQQQMIENQTRDFKAQQTWMQTVIVVVAAAVVVIAVVVVIVVRWARRSDRREISQQWRGYGYGGQQ